RRASKFDYAAKLAASLAYLMLGQGESVGIATFASRIERWVGPQAKTQQLSRVIDVLERAAPAAGGSDAPRAIHDAADRLGRRSLVIVVADLFAEAGALR